MYGYPILLHIHGHSLPSQLSFILAVILISMVFEGNFFVLFSAVIYLVIVEMRQTVEVQT